MELDADCGVSRPLVKTGKGKLDWTLSGTDVKSKPFFVVTLTAVSPSLEIKCDELPPSVGKSIVQLSAI